MTPINGRGAIDLTPQAVGAGDGGLDPADAVVDIADRVLSTARSDPNRVAMIHTHHVPLLGPRYVSYTYGELSRRAESLAVGLRRLGIREGTLCSFMVPPCFDSLVLGVALWRIGATTVGIEPHSHGLRRVARCLEQVGPEVFFGTPRAHAGRIAFGWGRGTIRTNVVVGPAAPPGMVTMDSLIGDPVDEPVRGDIHPEDVTIIAFTTGSTGNPKPTVLRQRNFANVVSMVKEQWGFQEGDEVIDMPTFPMFWIIGLSVGGTVVVPPMDFTVHGPGDADPARIIRTITDCRVSSMFASPALLENLSSYAISRGQTIPHLRRIVAGGAEIQGPLFEKVRSVLEPGAEMYSDYGATEALPVAEIAGATVVGETWPETVRGAGVCAGDTLRGVELRIIEVDDGPIASPDDARVLPDGEIGEIIVRSPHISENYYESPEADAENKIPAEPWPWHRIGDLGYLDDRGRLWLCGRVSHRVEIPGDTLYTLRCEPIFNALDVVERSALVGVRHDGRLVPTICIERRHDEPAPASLVESLVMDVAASHDATRAIERVVLMDRLPVDQRHNAKIDRPAIAAALTRAWAEGGTTRSVEIPRGNIITNMLK